VLIAIDGLDEAAEPESAMHALLELYRARDDLPLRILISTRQQPPTDLALVRVIEVSVATRQDLVESVRDRLAAARGSASAELTDQAAEVIADFACGHFLVANLMAGGIANGCSSSEVSRLVRRRVRIVPG
jgi:hypothetical protein